MDKNTIRAKMREKFVEDKSTIKKQMYSFPDLSGPMGNAYWLVSRGFGLIDDAIQNKRLAAEYRKEFLDEAMSGDYKRVLATIDKWFTISTLEVSYTPSLVSLADYYEATSGKKEDH